MAENSPFLEEKALKAIAKPLKSHEKPWIFIDF